MAQTCTLSKWQNRESSICTCLKQAFSVVKKYLIVFRIEILNSQNVWTNLSRFIFSQKFEKIITCMCLKSHLILHSWRSDMAIAYVAPIDLEMNTISMHLIVRWRTITMHILCALERCVFLCNFIQDRQHASGLDLMIVPMWHTTSSSNICKPLARFSCILHDTICWRMECTLRIRFEYSLIHTSCQ